METRLPSIAAALGAPVLALAVLMLSACGGGDSASSSQTPTTSAAATASRTPSPHPTATPSPSATTARVTPANTASPLDASAAALRAALAAVDPQRTQCVERSSLYPDSNEPLGISVLYVGCEAGYVLIMGRDQSGAWQVWFAGQNLYQPLTLPGDVRACGFGQGVNVRSSPSTTSSIVTTLAEATVAKAEEFVLTVPGTPGTADHQANWGYGWFRVSAPAAGWVYSKYLNGVGGIYSADCSDHDGLESQ